jgi:hypothetical protein
VGLKATIKLLNGFKEALVVRVANLPAGVHAAEVAVPEKGGEVEIKLQAATNAPAGNQAIQVGVWTKAEAANVKLAQASLRGENKRGSSLRDDTSLIWLTVK